MAGQANSTRLGFSTMNEEEIWQLLTNSENMVMLPRGAMGGSAGEVPAPASRASIEALAVVTNGQKDKCEDDCPICLEKLFKDENKDQVKEMPCGHRYHGECIETWLRTHRSCPVCRYEMPQEEEEEEDDDDIGFWMIIPD